MALTMKEAMADVERMAQKVDRLMYLYCGAAGYFASPRYWNDWLFKAYPGGRKEVSVLGNETLLAEEPPNTGLHTDELCRYPGCDDIGWNGGFCRLHNPANTLAGKA